MLHITKVEANHSQEKKGNIWVILWCLWWFGLLATHSSPPSPSLTSQPPSLKPAKRIIECLHQARAESHSAMASNSHLSFGGQRKEGINGLGKGVPQQQGVQKLMVPALIFEVILLYLVIFLRTCKRGNYTWDIMRYLQICARYASCSVPRSAPSVQPPAFWESDVTTTLRPSIVAPWPRGRMMWQNVLKTTSLPSLPKPVGLPTSRLFI